VSLGISDPSVRRILHKDFHNHPHKTRIVHALKDVEHSNRLALCQKLLNMINENPDLVSNLLMSDEAHFHLSSFVNKQSFRYWSSKNTQRFHKNPLHSAKLAVWCAISSFGILGPYFFEDGDGRKVTVNSQRYVIMFDNFLGPELVCRPVNYGSVGQSGALFSHPPRATHMIPSYFAYSHYSGCTT
jgi:hypothetical protein